MIETMRSSVRIFKDSQWQYSIINPIETLEAALAPENTPHFSHWEHFGDIIQVGLFATDKMVTANTVADRGVKPAVFSSVSSTWDIS